MRLTNLVIASALGLLMTMVGVDAQGQGQGNTCSLITCVHGQCIPLDPPMCICDNLYTGEYCQTYSNPCTSNPCEHGGTCTGTSSSEYTCNCQNLYTGNNCQLEANPCSPNPCGTGSCIAENSNTYICNCPTYYHGSDCSEHTNPCDATPCQNHGTCSAADWNTYSCSCEAGYTGASCQYSSTDGCSQDPCENGGTCSTDAQNRYSCQCPTGFSGSECQVDADECANSPCQNGGTCVDGAGTYLCDCPTGFTGTRCATEVDPCLPNPCQNGGVCSANGNSFQCACATGFNGNRCQNSIQPCSPNPCQNGGTCTESGNNFDCSCTAEFSGSRCQHITIQGSAKRDPHMSTFDGRRYNFQGLCWYTLVTVCKPGLPRFDVSTLFEPRPYDGIEVKTRPVNVIISVGDESVVLNKDNTYLVRRSLGNGEFMAAKPENITIRYDDEDPEKIIVELKNIKLIVTWIARDHMVFTDLADARYHGAVCGLLGDADGNPENDFTRRDGGMTDDIMDFGESWKVTKLTCPEYDYL